MRLLGIDFETTGVDVEKDVITEVGMCLWNTETNQPDAVESFLINWSGYDVPVISDEIIRVTGVRPEDCLDSGIYPPLGLARISMLSSMADFSVAHNGTVFDGPVYETCKKVVRSHPLHADASYVYGNWELFSSLTMIDTMVDLEYPESMSARKLTYLAADHGFMNPFPHRAIFDVITMMVILSKYDLGQVVHSARQPIITVQALVSFDDKDKAKERFFRWDPDRKRWIKQMKAHKYNPADYAFNTKVVDNQLSLGA